MKSELFVLRNYDFLLSKWAAKLNRDVEQMAKRMKPVDLDRLLRDEND
jgi:hypothetical protein